MAARRTPLTAVWTLARENEWYREGERAERFLLHRRPRSPLRNEAALDLIVAWHGEPIGHLRHDGFEWRWSPVETKGPPLIRQTTPGKLPPFIVSLLPEGWLESVLKDKDERSALRSWQALHVEHHHRRARKRARRAAARCPADATESLFEGWRIHRHLRRPGPR